MQHLLQVPSSILTGAIGAGSSIGSGDPSGAGITSGRDGRRWGIHSCQTLVWRQLLELRAMKDTSIYIHDKTDSKRFQLLLYDSSRF
jgi:hypothetical protein